MGKNRKLIQHLSEDTIKRVALTCLQSHYRFRPSLMGNNFQRNNYIDVQYDVQLDDGIIVDGYIAYRKGDGQLFTAAVEATSHQKKAEVRFDVQKNLLWWDGAAGSVVFCSILLFNIYWQADYSLASRKGGLLLFAFVASAVVLTYLYQWICKTFFTAIDRYHYIYAIEQFKRYEADEQWIAIGSDVFLEDGVFNEDDLLEGSLSPEFLELKDQCIKNGVGLIEVQKDLTPVILMTPSRDIIVSGKRKSSLTSFAKNQLKNLLAVTPKGVREKYSNTRSAIKQVLTAGNRFKFQKLDRFQRAYFTQIVVCAVPILMIGVLFILDWSERSYVYLDEEDYEELLETQTFGEDTYIDEKDSADYLYVQPFEDEQYSYLELPEDHPIFTLKERERRRDRSFLDISDFRPNLEEVEEAIPIYPIQERFIGFYFTEQGRIVDSTTCETYLSTSRPTYVVQQSIHPSRRLAFSQIDTLASKGINANLLSLGCVEAAANDYIVFMGNPMDSLETAVAQSIIFEQQLKQFSFDILEFKVQTFYLDTLYVDPSLY